MSVEATPAPQTSRLPPTGWHGDFFAVTPVGTGTDLDALRSPNGVVSVARADQSVGDLVKDRVPHLLIGISLDKVSGEFDPPGVAALGVETDPRPADIRVQPELPTDQAVCCHQHTGALPHTSGPFGQSKPARSVGHNHPLTPGSVSDFNSTPSRRTAAARASTAHRGDGKPTRSLT